MHLVASEHDLFQACRTLFDLDNDIPREFLEYLQLSGIKNAYRKKALETHPDRVAKIGVAAEQQNAELFKTIQQAYEHLTAYLTAREKGYRINFQERKMTSNLFPLETEKLYHGPIPDRKLLFGHYLYYTGHINWRLIIQALIWQRTQRPRLGELGVDFGWLKHTDIVTILKNCNNNQPFGRTAVKLGLLLPPQLNILLDHQLSLQKKFGAYFVEKNILTEKEINRLVVRQQSHNAKFVNPLHKESPTLL